MIAEDGTNDLYVGGDFTTYNGTAANHLIRLRPNGSVAQTFGEGFDEVVLALALATDGSNALYAGGPFTQFDGNPAPQLIRLSPSGLRDAAFQPGSLDFALWTLAVTEDGSRDVYAGGNVSVAVPGTPVSALDGRIARLNPDGTRDPMFSIGTGFPGAADGGGATIASIAVPPGSGKVYVGGSMFTYNGEPVSSLVRLNPDGTLDSTFMAGSGIPGSASTQIVEGITPAADASRDIFVGGRVTIYNGTPVTCCLIRVHENGALDTTYAPTVALQTFAFAPTRDGSGDVIASGLDSAGSIHLRRFSRNGVVVSSFGDPALDGLILTIVAVLDGTNDLYIGGGFTTYNGVPVNHIARIHADGTLASVVN